MSTTHHADGASTPVRRFRAWLLDNVVASLSIAGLVVYVSLRWPYSIYYGSLHTSPDDVGLGYTQVLAQSALGVFALAAVAALASTILLFVVGYVLLVSRFLASLRALRNTPTVPTPDGADLYSLSDAQLASLDNAYYADLSDRQIDELLLPAIARGADQQLPKLGKIIFEITAPQIRKVMLARRAWASAGMIGQRPRPKHNTSDALRMLARLMSNTVRPWVAVIFLGWIMALMYVAVPVYAHVEADHVKKNCSSPSDNLAFFDFRAQPARLSGHGLGAPAHDRFIYLGQGSSTYVLFDCDSQRTLAVPISGSRMSLGPSD